MTSRKMPPTHPGLILREIVGGLNMDVGTFAKHLGVHRTTMSGLLNGRVSVSDSMAWRLGVALGNGFEFWLRLQFEYDLWQTAKLPAPKVSRLK